MADPLMNIPGLAGYLSGQQRDQQMQTGQLQQATGLMGILAQAQKQQQMQGVLAKEQAFRADLAALGPNPDQGMLAQVAAKYAAPGDVMKTQQASADRQAAMTQRADDRTFQADQARVLQGDKLTAAAEAAKLRSEDQRLSQAERNQARMDMIRLAASLRPAPQPRPEQPPVAVMGPDGKPVFVNRADAIGKAPAVKETADRVIPANIAKAYTENSTALRKIDSALSEVESYPGAFGLQNIRGDAISQRVDPKGVTARAIIADIGSLKIHDRSGAAVTAAETPRLLPFIPGVNDNAATIKKKLDLFRKEYAAIQNDIGSMYSEEQGYRALPGAQTRSSDKTRIKFDAQGNPVP